MFFTDFFLLECSNDFKRIMQIWACAVKLFENVQKMSVKIQTSKFWLIGQYRWLIGQYRWLLCQFQLQLQISTILSHGMLEVVATRHRLQRLWGRIVISIFEIKSSLHKFWQAGPQGKWNFLIQQKFSQWLYLE